MFGVDSILGTRADADDYYKIFGCNETATVDQITTEYRIRALKYHPDKNIGDEAALEMFQKLQEARDTLIDPERRCKYDQWRQSGICMPYKQWLGLSSRCQMTMHWSNPKTGLMLEGNGHQNHGNVKLEQQNDAQADLIEDVGTVTKVNKPWKPERSGMYNKFRNYQI